MENLTIADFALCPSHLFLLISIFAFTDFGKSRQSSLIPFVIARFYCIVSNAFKPYLTGVIHILKFLRHLIKKQGRIHSISCLPSLFLPAEKRGYGLTNGPTNQQTNGLTDGWTPSLKDCLPKDPAEQSRYFAIIYQQRLVNGKN